jgi:hypothetical protein
MPHCDRQLGIHSVDNNFSCSCVVYQAEAYIREVRVLVSNLSRITSCIYKSFYGFWRLIPYLRCQIGHDKFLSNSSITTYSYFLYITRIVEKWSSSNLRFNYYISIIEISGSNTGWFKSGKISVIFLSVSRHMRKQRIQVDEFSLITPLIMGKFLSWN